MRCASRLNRREQDAALENSANDRSAPIAPFDYDYYPADVLFQSAISHQREAARDFLAVFFAAVPRRAAQISTR